MVSKCKPPDSNCHLSFRITYVNSLFLSPQICSFSVFFISLIDLPESDVKALAAQSGPTLCDPVDCSPPGSSVHGILQARVLEWVAIPFSRGSSWARDWTLASHIVGRPVTLWTTWEAQLSFLFAHNRTPVRPSLLSLHASPLLNHLWVYWRLIPKGLRTQQPLFSPAATLFWE